MKSISDNPKWEVTKGSTVEYIKDGHDKLALGDFSGMLNLIFGSIFQAGNSADFSSYRKISNEELGLETEDLVKVTKEVMETD